MMTNISNILLIDIDGLRSDVFAAALKSERIPNIAQLLGGSKVAPGAQIPVLAPAPSITFCSQASLFTGTHPSQHGIPGNQFFDRFGTYSNGVPRHYAFDVGDTLAADDAVCVFTDGLAAKCLQKPTLYQQLVERGWQSVVAGNMYATGAKAWIKPSLVDIARFTKGGNLFGLSSEEYDGRILNDTINYLDKNGLPEVLTIHFLGLDHESHIHGPGAQMDYLINHVDPMIGELWDAISSLTAPNSMLIAIFSDHGQIEVFPDDRHSLRLAFPLERELGHLFDALGLDIHDYPGEDPNCDAVVASNGGLAFVYLQNRRKRWADLPDFQRDVLPVGKAFWEAHATGRYAEEVQGALAGVLVRNVEREGWFAPYQALTDGGKIESLEDWFSTDRDGLSESLYADPINRLNNLAGPMTGDVLLVSNYAEGFYFGAPITGIHGGLHPEDSQAVLAYGFPDVDTAIAKEMRIVIRDAIQNRCSVEGGRQPSTVDLMTGLFAVLE
ncbi:MAG: alkaline phosphatase family protein [Anaerolineales bacterium]|nr:alkaline phosphatase family protein [Chloroflexota bacterium]MBL6982345.1 alkaline phosphatase family protein [Anaerolineales bacterium]